MEFLTAIFSSKCAETGKTIKKGESICYDRPNKKAYCDTSKKYQDARESKSVSDYVQAQEDAYYDNFCRNNNM